MKKLVNPESTSRPLMSRGNSRMILSPRRAILATIGPDGYEDATVSGIYDLSRIRETVVEGAHPDNIVRFTLMPTPRRKA